MSTTATITRVIEQTECGIKVALVYVHTDGHRLGEQLKQYYTSENKVIDLINHGDIYSLSANIYPDSFKPHTFDNSQDNVCLFYCRDGGNDWEDCKPIVYVVKQLIDLRNIDQQEYNYIFMNGKWYVRRDYSNTLKEV